jgi:hypothetical protein
LSGIDVYRKNKGFSWSSNKHIVRVDAQWCERSVSAYLSKYVSKDYLNNSQKTCCNPFFCPTRWYGVSRPLLSALRDMTKEIRLEFLPSSLSWAIYEDCLSLLQSFALKSYSYNHKVGDGKTIVAYFDENDQDSIWESVMNQVANFQVNKSASVEESLRRCARNGSILIKRHGVWFKEFLSYYANSHVSKLLALPSLKDVSRSDILFLIDALAYSFRSFQRTRYDLPGECKLWYSRTKEVIDSASPADRNWIGALRL